MSGGIGCEWCKGPMSHKKRGARFCCSGCRDRAWHAAHPGWRSANHEKHGEKRRAAARAYHHANREKMAAKCKQWKENNPERIRAAIYVRGLKKYGLVPADYDRMLEHQGGRCAVCGETSPRNGPRVSRFHVDHNHETGEVRGLLCHGCNSALGHARDSAAILRALAKYLDERGGRRELAWVA